MLVVCEECGKRYRVDARKINGKRAAFTCKACKHRIIFAKPQQMIKGGRVDVRPASPGKPIRPLPEETWNEQRSKRPGVRTWEHTLIGKKGIEKIDHDTSLDALIEEAEKIGNLLKAGSLKACFVSKGKSNDMIMFPDNETKAISVSSEIQRDPIFRLIKD